MGNTGDYVAVARQLLEQGRVGVRWGAGRRENQDGVAGGRRGGGCIGDRVGAYPGGIEAPDGADGLPPPRQVRAGYGAHGTIPDRDGQLPFLAGLPRVGVVAGCVHPAVRNPAYPLRPAGCRKLYRKKSYAEPEQPRQGKERRQQVALRERWDDAHTATCDEVGPLSIIDYEVERSQPQPIDDGMVAHCSKSGSPLYSAGHLGHRATLWH